MTQHLTRDNVHETLLQDVIHTLDTEADALTWMTLLHTYTMYLSEPLVADAPEVTTFGALTQREAAATISNIWNHHCGKKTHPEYWYHLWNEKHAYEVIEDVPPTVLTRMLEFRALLVADTRIRAVEPDRA